MEVHKNIEYLLSANDSIKAAQLLKKQISEYINSLENIFKQKQGKEFLVRHTKQIDEFINLIFKYTLRDFFGNYMPLQNSLPINLIAMGSYAREELCVYSDLDLMIVYKDVKGYDVENIVKSMLYLAWDCGIKMSHRVHKVEDLFQASKEDITIKTAMIESRFICGSKYLWVEIQNELEKIQKYKINNFLTQKIKLYQDRKINFNITMEPNLKDGAGGLRDIHTIFWICKILFKINKLQDLTPKYINDEDFKDLRMSLEFIYKLRTSLHLIARKKQDTLVLEYIPQVAKMLDFKDKKTINAQTLLAKTAIKSLWKINILSEIYIRKISSKKLYNSKNIAKLKNGFLKNGFFILKNTLFVSLNKKPWDLYELLKFFSKFKDEKITFDISVINFMRNTKIPSHNDTKMYETISLFFRKKYLYQYLYAFYKAEIFQYIFKPLKHILYLPQFDGYHAYTVEIHSFKCIKVLENIEDNFIKSLYDDLCEDGRFLLKIVILFHDCGKNRGKDHSQIGAKIFKSWAKKIALKQKMIDIGEKLILNHTLMSNVANRQDIYNEKVIFSFLGLIQNEQILKLLYILTYCDIKGVSKTTYSTFNSRLLRELYDISLETFDKNELIDEAQRRIRKENALKNNPNFNELKNYEKKQILSIQSNLFFLKFNSNEIINIAKLAFNTKSVSIDININKKLTITFIRKNDINISYILSKLVYLNVIEMEIFDLFDNLKYFKIYFSDNIDEQDLPLVRKLIEDSLSKKMQMPKIKPIIYPEEFILDCEHSKTYAQMSLNAKDQKGLLAYIMYIFDKFNIKISSAKIQTIKNRARNLFLIEKQGILCENKENIMSLLYTYSK